MKSRITVLAAGLCLAFGMSAFAATHGPDGAPSGASHTPPKATQVVTQGSVTVEGNKIDYDATAGTIILTDRFGKPTGSMFYVAYTKRGVSNESQRPVTFFYNGGPGSSTIWLHMGAYGPQRIVTADHTHTPAAPYQLVNNEYSLLDVTDEVFIDAMSTGYSRIIRKDQGGIGKWQDFYGVDPDVKSFGQFIVKYLTHNNRWNSPKYLYGESYGTLRSEVLADYLTNNKDMDLNGVILQSAYMGNAIPFGTDTQYETILPTMAADAWYHKKLPNPPADLPSFLATVEHFALNQYALALNQGNALSQSDFDAIAEKLHEYTGLSTAYIEKANLRVSSGEFFHQLLNDEDMTVGRLDGRFIGPTMNPMSQTAEYDPQSSAISSAYAAGFNWYAANVLKYHTGLYYRPEAYNIVHPWPREDTIPGGGFGFFGGSGPPVNGGIDLAQAMKYDPLLHVEVEAGYYDFATPYFSMMYEVNHMNLPKDLQSHIQFKYYESGHMIYVHVPGLKKLHDNVAAFIRGSDNPQG
ncbi:MAG: S10 family peptidase [Gammaproteobacteria bacterium]